MGVHRRGSCLSMFRLLRPASHRYGGQASTFAPAVLRWSIRRSGSWLASGERRLVRKGDSNPHDLATASPSSWCVCCEAWASGSHKAIPPTANAATGLSMLLSSDVGSAIGTSMPLYLACHVRRVRGRIHGVQAHDAAAFLSRRREAWPRYRPRSLECHLPPLLVTIVRT